MSSNQGHTCVVLLLKKPAAALGSPNDAEPKRKVQLEIDVVQAVDPTQNSTSHEVTGTLTSPIVIE
jgi:hypothetical protein